MSSAIHLQSIRGMGDVLPAGNPTYIYQSANWTALRAAFAEWAELHGYGYIETPVLEPTELFKRSSGHTSDIVSKEMYAFETRGGDQVALRPEGSASVCRAIVEHGLAQSSPRLKFYYVAPMFRAERPQRGRYRQHTQLGLEVFKESDPTADAEVIAVLWKFYDRLGIKGHVVHLNSVGCPNCRPAYREKLVAHFEPVREKLTADSRERLATNPMRILDSKVESDQELAVGAPMMRDHLCAECAAHFDGVQRALAALAVPVVLEPKLVRGLDYYTKTAFEVICDSLDGAIKVIGGGGRYDGLVELLGGPPTPAVGFGAGVERVLLALESQKLELGKPRKPEVLVVYFDETAKLEGLAVAEELRSAGIATEFIYGAKNATKQLKEAGRFDVRLVVFTGGDEGARAEVSIKDFAAKTQLAVRRCDVVNAARAALGRERQ